MQPSVVFLQPKLSHSSTMWVGAAELCFRKCWAPVEECGAHTHRPAQNFLRGASPDVALSLGPEPLLGNWSCRKGVLVGAGLRARDHRALEGGSQDVPRPPQKTRVCGP